MHWSVCDVASGKQKRSFELVSAGCLTARPRCRLLGWVTGEDLCGRPGMSADWGLGRNAASSLEALFSPDRSLGLIGCRSLGVHEMETHQGRLIVLPFAFFSLCP